MGRFPQKRILITGAGSGLGRALALRFGHEGWRVACTDLRAEKAAETVAEILRDGGQGMSFALDVSSEAQFDGAAAQLETAWGGVDVLINNAGVATAGTVAESSLEQWRWVLDINLLGCVRGARAVIPLMVEQRRGHIVNIASFAGIANPPAMASYNAAKAAVISLSETLRLELADQGIGVSVACPSFFATALIDNSEASAPEGGEAAPQMSLIARKLMKKSAISADDVALDIYRAVLRDRFLVISHAEARNHYRIKRLSPELFFRAARKSTAAFLKRS
jgi:NAD(P)-dependent dehydrogenase (short-subunit alcohol dehydrogenase family)